MKEVKGLGYPAIRTYRPQYSRVFKVGDFARYLRKRLRQEDCVSVSY